MRIEYRRLEKEEICRELFGQFIRRQEVTKCWRREEGKWVVRDAPFIDDWSEEDYQPLRIRQRPAERYGAHSAAVFLRGSHLLSQNRSEAGGSTLT